jgi:hypothetical protein
MKLTGLKAFTKAREEIWFWPSAALAYLVTLEGSIVILVGFFISLFTGATMYKLHEALRELFEDEKDISRIRRRVSREGTANSSELSFDLLQDLFSLVAPSRPVSQLLVVVGMLANIMLFLLLYLWILWRVFSIASPTITVMSLFSLPLLMIAIASASLVWNS